MTQGETDSICRTDGKSNGRCVPRFAFHAVPDGTYDPQDVIAAVDRAAEIVPAELVPYLSDSFGPDMYLPCGCHVTVPKNNSIENAAQSIKELRDAGVNLGALPNLSCDECSQLTAKVISYAKRKVQSAPDRSLGHKHEVNRDAAQRIQASRENAVSMIDDHAIHA